MICSRWPWTLRLTSSAHQSVARNQKRCKAFVRRLDKNNEVYYTISNKRPPKSPESIPVRDDFFEMPDLLLDLDADGSRFVRPVDEADEERLERKWDVNQKRLNVQHQLKQLRDQIDESRKKADDILSNPANIWRLDSHDILSAALRCPPGTANQIDISTATSEAPPALNRPTLSQDPRFLETLCRENGIPPHALQDDQVLLEWMLLRFKSLKRSITNRSEEPLSPSQLASSLKDSTSITDIRRLVFHALSSAERAQIYFPKTKAANDDSKRTLNVAREIRNACLNVLNEHPERAVVHLEILGFIGNLAARLSSYGATIPPALTGLALRLSAAAGLTGATSEWLHRGFVNRMWEKHTASSKDVAEALTTFTQHLGNPGEGGLYAVHDRQLFLQLLTGIDENHALSSDSLRSLPLFYLGEQSQVPTDRAYEMYESYMTLLGRLGAVRTIWKEWHVSRPIVTRFLKPNDGIQRLKHLYETSLLSALRVAAPLETRCPPDMELGECIAQDYHSIAAQDTNSWRANATEAARSSKPTNISSSGLPSFDLPLDEWIAKLDEADHQRPPSAR
ncbi:hypothetical protein CFAM422_006049 [Trichoderma lentiforme]|uniref:Uncharacterized protein n=1 Tax=Trichoderma lentiforme TaxID=1567552 RepID=A0A9P5CET7_9HYPO|nr:hypothetical protein CFAM422_006049 [Trichoderma lentiforme]